MAAPTLSDYIKRKGLQVENIQKLLNHYGELYQFYSDKLPKNKYINFLEENTFTEGFSTIAPAASEFLSLRPDQLSFMRPYVRIFKKFKSTGEKIEFPFENKTDLTSLENPQAYIGEAFPFASQRFNGPTALLQSLGIQVGGINGQGVTTQDQHWVRVNFDIFFQDAKLIFKNWGTKEKPLRYKDLFSVPGTKSFIILLEIGYNIPDGADDSLKLVSAPKAVYELYSYGMPSSFDYNESGELSLRFELQGNFERIHDTINILDAKYYKQVKKSNNMIAIDDDTRTSIEEYEKEIIKLSALEEEIKQNLESKQKPDKKEKLTQGLARLRQNIKQRRTLVQLAKSSGAAPESFPFIAALYEAGLIYYFELDNEVYKDYIKKIAKGEPVDVSDINYLPKRKQKNRLDPEDFLKKNPETSAYFANTLKIKRLNNGEGDSSNCEKMKYFYFGDLVQVMLNNSKGTGVGQDLDKNGATEFSFLFGTIMWIKNEKTKILYNILNTPISLDMFLFEMNKEIYQKNRKSMSFSYFFSTFMKRFFDLTVFGYEKSVSGKQNQKYLCGTSYVFDKERYYASGKFKRNLYDYVPTADTRDTVTVRIITTLPEEHAVTSQKAKKRNVPNFYFGGPDKGPLMRINFQTSPIPGQAEAYFAARMRGENVDVLGESIGDSEFDSMIITQSTIARLELFGNVFFKPGDFIFIDSRFVDGGFFTEKGHNIFFTSMFSINSISHRFDGVSGRWMTSINAQGIPKRFEEDASYKAYAGELPRTQNVDIGDQANLGRQDIIDTSNYNSNVDRQNAELLGQPPPAKKPPGITQVATPPSVSLK